ncbi:11483_t:CDS:2 [Cetraspora pellucida]|uniref:11483_t:CDS:1 n=1 Tax=Cetraspora pellucida TaxID=1433469 RepID=A0ACA9L9A2_9GLOM|nr:11483_t:CDS:2 [Cetraspora pellucida]
MSTRQHSSLTAAPKCSLCETKEKNPHLTYNELANIYQIGRSTVSDILKEKTRWLSISDAEQEKKNIDGNILKEKAKFFAKKLNINDFSQSEGWLSGFKKRNGLRSFKKHGESASAPSKESMDNDRANLQQLLQEDMQIDYNQNDIENILNDEEDDLENLIAQLSENDLLNAHEYICVEDTEIEGSLTDDDILKAVADENEDEIEQPSSEIKEKVSCTKAEIALDTILRFLYEQDEEFGEVEKDAKILRRLHRRVRLLCIKNLKQVEISRYFVNE